MNKKKLNNKSLRMKMRAASMCSTNEMMRIPEITTEELRTAINKLKKKANPQTASESEQKTSKHAMIRREKW